MSLLVGNVEAIDQDLASVAADVGHADHGNNGPVTAVQDSVRQRDDEHALDGVGHVPASLPFGNLVTRTSEFTASEITAVINRIRLVDQTPVIDSVVVAIFVKVRQFSVVGFAAEFGEVQLLLLVGGEAGFRKGGTN